MSRLLAIVALLLGPGTMHGAAELTLYGPAKIGIPETAVPIGARATAMAEAYVASGNDAYSLHYNPAGLSRLSGFELGLAHNEWSSALGVRQEFLTYAQRLSPGSGFAVSGNYFTLGKLETRANDGALIGDSQAFAFSGTAGYAWSMLSRKQLKLGVSGEYAMESLFSSGLTSFGFGLGAMYDLGRDINFGVVGTHLGSGSGGASTPAQIAAGFSALMLNRGLTLDLDAVLPLNADPGLRAGAELDFGSLALRGGWRASFGAHPGDVQSGPTAGAGFNAGLFSLDYAFVPYGELAATHRISATLKLPADFFKPKVIGGAATTTTAKAFYEKAQAFEASGDLLQALVQYQRAEEDYPEALRAAPQQFYLSTKTRIREVQSEINRRGDNGQVRKLTRELTSKAAEFMAGYHFKEAIDQLLQAKKLDPENTDLDRQLKIARQGLEERLGGVRAEARAAEKAGRLAVALDAYIKVQQIDPADHEADVFFSAHRSEIEALLLTIHRKGIDYYVAGHLAEAVDIWKKGRALDIFGGKKVNFDRDIEKASKLLELSKRK